MGEAHELRVQGDRSRLVPSPLQQLLDQLLRLLHRGRVLREAVSALESGARGEVGGEGCEQGECGGEAAGVDEDRELGQASRDAPLVDTKDFDQ